MVGQFQKSHVQIGPSHLNFEYWYALLCYSTVHTGTPTSRYNFPQSCYGIIRYKTRLPFSLNEGPR